MRQRCCWRYWTTVSVLFSEPKIPQTFVVVSARSSAATVSVLFSEPKIPQMRVCSQTRCAQRCFSALQRAENSSNNLYLARLPALELFQCSSASRKFLKARIALPRRSSSAVSVLFSEPKIPQTVVDIKTVSARECFSALQRAENSSNVPKRVSNSTIR